MILVYFCVSMTAAPLDPLSRKPTLKDLDEIVIVRVAGKWYITGLQLDITSGVLEAIKKSYGSSSDCCLEMFKCWLDGQRGCGTLPRTWCSVLEAVKKSCGTEVCREIKEDI